MAGKDKKSPEIPGSDYEPVDGARIAAQILNRMGNEKKKLVERIQKRNPGIARKIEEKSFTFEDIENLTPKAIQTLLSEVNHGDLVVSLKLASDSARKILFENMSERKRSMVADDFQALPAMRLSEVKEARKRVLEIADRLRTSGKLQGDASNDVWV